VCIALAVAFGGNGATDQSGRSWPSPACRFGFAACVIVAITLWALGASGSCWRASSYGRHSMTHAGLAEQMGQADRGVGAGGVFIALGLIAAAVALGARSGRRGGR
jgi:hypothetical protein